MRHILQIMLVFTLLSSTAHAQHMNDNLYRQSYDKLVITHSSEHKCLDRGAVCFFPGNAATQQSNLGEASESAVIPYAPFVPEFTRLNKREPAKGETNDWVLDVRATLDKKSYSGNAIFLVYDDDQPGVYAEREVTALFQSTISSGMTISARLVFGLEDGFVPRHRYLVRIVQLINGRELVLAEGRVKLK